MLPVGDDFVNEKPPPKPAGNTTAIFSAGN